MDTELVVDGKRITCDWKSGLIKLGPLKRTATTIARNGMMIIGFLFL